MMRCIRDGGPVAVILVSLTPSLWAADFTQPTRSQLGMNLSPFGPVSSQWDFTDFAKKRTTPIAASTSNVTLPDGSVTELDYTTDGDGDNSKLTLATNQAVQYYVTHGNPYAPQGVYTVQWRGDARVEFANRWTLVGAPTFDQTTGVWTAKVQTGNFDFSLRDFSKGMRLNIRGSSQANTERSISDLRIYQPGYGPGEPGYGQTFDATFKSEIQPFGAIRFMDWMNTNRNTTTHLADPAETAPSYSQVSDLRYNDGRGTPVEHMVALANEMNQDAYFNMPFAADNEKFVRKFAEYVRDNLDPNLKVYVEYANEVWNNLDTNTTQNDPHDYLMARTNETTPWTAAAAEAKADFAVWSEVFAGQEHRLVRVAAVQNDPGGRFHAPRFLSKLKVSDSDKGYDALAIPAYIYGPSKTYTANTTVEQIFADLVADLERRSDQTLEKASLTMKNFFNWTTQPKGDWAFYRGLADELGVPLLAYEGGQHLVPINNDTKTAWYDTYLELERDPRMYALYRLLLKAWFDTDGEGIGADMFFAFNNVSGFDQYGAWGVQEYQAQSIAEAHKYRAFLDHLSGVPMPTLELPEPAVVGWAAMAGGLLLRPRRRGS